MKDVRRALITGASSGIGLALAQRLAVGGIEVWLVARRAEMLERAVAAIRESGGQAHAVVLDVGDVDRTRERLAEIDAASGGIDLVVANAGVAGAQTVVGPDRMRWEVTRAIFNVNLVGAAATFAAFIPGMVQRGRGHLVGVSSLAADIPLGASAAYCASKAGLTRYLEALDGALRTSGIAVTIVHPGFVKTSATEQLGSLPLLMETERAAFLIERAISRRTRLVRFPWILGFLARAAAALPAALRDAMIRIATAGRTERPDF
jgi:short-subunit dehydrogenase